uniref:WD_REPEATS_REGION domain-containing protein n=1 Tax=Gongylonema pulchrum TaxID=637853 RepID=A0A183EWF3_9BILA
LTKPHLATACASSICISSCGNFGVVGYTSGHIDCFNLQSGLHRKSFKYSNQKSKAHQSAVSAEQDGLLRFWDFRWVKLIAELKVPSPVVQFCMCSTNSLLAIGVGNGSIGIVDVLCRKVVRIFSGAHKSKLTALDFSPDGKWLVSADEDGLIKVCPFTSHFKHF